MFMVLTILLRLALAFMAYNNLKAHHSIGYRPMRIVGTFMAYNNLKAHHSIGYRLFYRGRNLSSLVPYE
jgi:hypothetical protein